MAYLEEVVPYSRWKWLRGEKEVTTEPLYCIGSANILSNSNVVTLTEAFTNSLKGYNFKADAYDEVYTIKQHTAGSPTLRLNKPYRGIPDTSALYKIWRDYAILPQEAKETFEVRHAYLRDPLTGYGLQEFRALTNAEPARDERPFCYTTGSFVEEERYDTITGFPASVSRSGTGSKKFIVFASEISSSLKVGDKFETTGAGRYQYNGEGTVAEIGTTSVTDDTLTYITEDLVTETSAADTAITLRELSPEGAYERYRKLHVYPAVSLTPTSLHVDYIKQAEPLADDNDEPLIPLEDRIVLLYGTLARAWRRERNPEEATVNLQLFRDRLARMKGKNEDSLDKPLLKVSKIYLQVKRNQPLRTYKGDAILVGGISVAVVKGTANRVAIFDSDGNIASSTVTDAELAFLTGVTSNIQTQLDAITTLADGTFYLGDATNTAQEVTLTGDVTSDNAGVMAISPDVITDSDVNSAAAISRSKLGSGAVDRVVINDSGGDFDDSAITSTELTFLDEVEPLTPVVLTDNTGAPTDAALFTQASFNSVTLLYSVSRGSTIVETGYIRMSHDGSTVDISQGGIASLGTTGVTFTADLSGGNMRLRYTTTSTGTDAALNYKTHKWSA